MLTPDEKERLEYFEKFVKPHQFEALRYRSIGIQVFWAAQAALFAAWAASHNVALIWFGLAACISFWLFDERNRFFILTVHEWGEQFADKHFFPCKDGEPLDGVHVRFGRSMKKYPFKSHTFAIRLLLVASGLAWLVIGFGQLQSKQSRPSSMPVNSTFPHWSEVAALVTAIATTVTMAFLIWYAVETYRLRKASQRQNEIAVDLWKTAQRQSRIPFIPIVVVYVAPEKAQGGHLTLDDPAIRNIGNGPAFQVEIQTLQIGAYEVRFTVVPLVERDKSIKLDYTIWQDGQTAEFPRGSVLLQSVISANETRLELPLVITFRDMAGNRYCSRPTIVYDPMAKEIRTEYGNTAELQ
jgi:hypothetical protein